MKTRTIALFAGAAALATASAFANHHAEGESDWEAEFEAAFAKVDADGDGNVSSEEYMAYKKAEAEAAWADYATSAGDDGVVSLDEAKAHYLAKKAEKEAKMKEGGEE